MDELDQITLKQGEIGEIIVSGKHVLDAYFNNETALKRNKIFIGASCWHRTGDSGFFNENGELFLTGRCNTLLEHDGKLIAPFVYENKLQSLDDVRMATVIEKEGKILLCLETSNHADREKLNSRISQLGLIYHETRYLSQIPRDPRHHSKIDYEKLRSKI